MSSATKVDAGWLLGPVRQDDGQATSTSSAVDGQASSREQQQGAKVSSTTSSSLVNAVVLLCLQRGLIETSAKLSMPSSGS
ncbi:hypothetical protein PoMZ_09882 [Pyricularia oryzae]|uniref:Uncharacterized protein n=1 Tax=Pyricularia oryzae TaxID=318829 RepID=A0A4P7MVM8_PYROR|nr:hypothetical protein PoMZ_09882 [Pyricularia oryzae]